MSAKRDKAEAKSVGTAPLPIEKEFLESHSPVIGAALRSWIETGQVPPVLLLSGPRGSGKREIAYYLAQTLQCENAGFTEKPADLFGGAGSGAESPALPAACQTCPSCIRANDSQALDFREIALIEDARTLGIDQFREIKESLGFSGYSGGYRIFLITEAERMTVQAANSLLKILEEPPPGWIFLLTVADASLLPATVVSRCQMLRLRPLSEDALVSLLRKREVPADRLAVVAAIGEGSLSRAMELASDDAWEIRGELLRFLVSPETAYFSLLDYAAGDVNQFRNLLDQFEPLLADLILRSQSSDAPLRNRDAQRPLEEHAAKCMKKLGGRERAAAFWIERVERLFRIRREMTAPLNQKVLAQDFLSPFMDAV